MCSDYANNRNVLTNKAVKTVKLKGTFEMWLKILKQGYMDKYGDNYEIGKEYIARHTFCFVKAEEIGNALEYFDGSDIRDLHFLEVEVMGQATQEGSWATYNCKKIKFVREVLIDEVLNIDKTGQVRNRMRRQ